MLINRRDRKLMCLLLLFTSGAAAGQSHLHHNSMAPVGEPAVVDQLSVPDVVLISQDGKKVRFYSDLVRGKVVVINTIFTTCTTICPPMGANFSKLQRLLGDRLGRDVELISISVDPAVDTPQRLKAWAGKFHRGPGWTLLTGPKRTVDDLLKVLKVFTVDKEDHSPIVLVGNSDRGEWTRAHALVSADKLANLIDNMMEEGD
ncbi:MAG: SCO family protein [Acidobacteriota bacterium]